MNKAEFKADVQRLRDIHGIIKMKESKLDPGLTENARNERKAAIFKEFSVEMSEIKIRLAQGVAWLQEQRAILADSFYALATAALEQADNANHGHAIVAANVAWMPDDSVINMLAGAWHPAVLLAVASNLKARMDGHEDPVQKRKMRDAIMTACERFVKWDAVAEYASWSWSRCACNTRNPGMNLQWKSLCPPSPSWILADAWRRRKNVQGWHVPRQSASDVSGQDLGNRTLPA